MTPGHIWDLEVCSVRSCLQCVKPADNKWAFVEERTLGSKGTLPGPGHIAMHCQSCNFLLRLPLKLVIRKVLKGIAHLQIVFIKSITREENVLQGKQLAPSC